ncbi:MAG: hypothetical protein ABJG47_11545 [Ekhidna sp.]
MAIQDLENANNQPDIQNFTYNGENISTMKDGLDLEVYTYDKSVNPLQGNFVFTLLLARGYSPLSEVLEFVNTNNVKSIAYPNSAELERTFDYTYNEDGLPLVVNFGRNTSDVTFTYE